MDDPARYFATAVDGVLGDHLTGAGFAPQAESPTRVTYRRDRTVVSFAFFVEDLPSPWVAVDVGLAEPDGSTRLAGLWRALEDGDPARRYTSWRFDSESSLEEVLRRIWMEVLAEHGPRVWDSEGSLEALLADQSDETETRYLEDRRRADLAQARRAYDDGRYQDAIDGYVLLEPGSLSAADRRRLHDARRRAGDASASSS